MCDLFVKLTEQKEIMVAAAFVLGLLLEYFPKLKDWEVYQRDLIVAGLAIVLPVGAFLLGAVQGCWLLTWDAALPFVLAGLTSMVAALGGERVTSSQKDFRVRNK